MKPNEIEFMFCVLSLGMMLLALAQSFRGDEIIRAIKTGSRFEKFTHRAYISMFAMIAFMIVTSWPLINFVVWYFLGKTK